VEIRLEVVVINEWHHNRDLAGRVVNLKVEHVWNEVIVTQQV
jgi:hypothetical protein